MNVDKEKIDAAIESRCNLVQERSDGVPVRFIASRNHLDPRHDAIVAMAAYDERAMLASVDISIDPGSHVHHRRSW
jgi:hypothetical protein